MNDRRALLHGAAVAAGAAVLTWIAPQAAAQNKVSKEVMKYQDKPHDGQQCDTCMQYIPGSSATAMGTCKVVAGPVSPHGWCVAYVKKA